MTEERKPAPHHAAAHDHASAKPKASRPAAPRPAPRAPIPSAPAPVETSQSRGKIAAAVGVTLAAGALIGRGLFGVASKLMRRRS